MSTVNALPLLDSTSAAWDLALDRKFTTNVVESFQPNIVLFNNEYPGVLKMTDEAGYQGQFLQKAPEPEPDEGYVPGNELQGQASGFREDMVTLDQPLVVHKWFRSDHIDVAHFPIIEPVFSGMGESLARKLDKRGFITLAKAARGGSVTDSQGNLTIHNGGQRVTRTGGSVLGAYSMNAAGALLLRTDMDALCAKYDLASVPRPGRIAYITPQAHQIMQQDTGIFDVRFSQNQSAANLQMSIVGEMSGFQIVMVNDRLPAGNLTGSVPWVDQYGNSLAGSGVPSKYQGDFRANGAAGTGASATGTPIVLAVGGVRQGSAPVAYRQIGGLRMDRKWVAEKQSWFASISVLGGFGQMHTYTAGSIEVTTS